jgi:hypothetical protein
MSDGQVHGVSHANGHVTEAGVRAELERVLASHEFRTSKRSQDFLRYVVEHTLSGRADMLKERTIGIEVFGRSSSYEPSDDATVRVKAGDVRKRLGLCYAEPSAQSSIRIELPAGTYVPEFRWVEAMAEASAPVAHPTIIPEPVSRESRRSLVAACAVGVVCLAVATGLWLRARPANTLLDQFWSPVLSGVSPISLCVAFVPVYGLDREPNATAAAQPADFVLMTDQFVGGGDLIATARISSMLTRMQRPYQLRVGSDVSFQDLRSAPAVLIGYSYTRWKEISSQMRFFIDITRKPIGITDDGVPTEFNLPNLPPDRRTAEDYAIVSRVFHPDTHAMLVELAGVTQYGTAAAADLVTNADLLAEALHGAPSDWRSKNLQLVLHVKVLSGTPSSPKIVKSHFW